MAPKRLFALASKAFSGSISLGKGLGEVHGIVNSRFPDLLSDLKEADGLVLRLGGLKTAIGLALFDKMRPFTASLCRERNFS